MRLLVCRPEGGLNDMFCQIQKCVWYCKKFARSLVLDASGTRIFCDEWNHYFRFCQPGFQFCTEKRQIAELLSKVQRNDVDSQEVFESLNTGNVEYSDLLNFHFRGRSLTFDFSTDHQERVLFHHQCGGGSDSHRFLGQVCLQPPLVKRLETQLRRLPYFYDGIHCRNTDMKSDLTKFKIPAVKRSFFLATDSSSAQKFFSSSLGKSPLYLSDSELNGDLPLHEAMQPQLQKRVFNEHAICDLISLGLSVNIYATNASSGYSSLAKFLNANPRFVLKMLSGTGVSFRVRARAMICILHKTFARFQPVKERPPMA